MIIPSFLRQEIINLRKPNTFKPCSTLYAVSARHTDLSLFKKQIPGISWANSPLLKKLMWDCHWNQLEGYDLKRNNRYNMQDIYIEGYYFIAFDAGLNVTKIDYNIHDYGCCIFLCSKCHIHLRQYNYGRLMEEMCSMLRKHNYLSTTRLLEYHKFIYGSFNINIAFGNSETYMGFFDRPHYCNNCCKPLWYFIPQMHRDTSVNHSLGTIYSIDFIIDCLYDGHTPPSSDDSD